MFARLCTIVNARMSQAKRSQMLAFSLGETLFICTVIVHAESNHQEQRISIDDDDECQSYGSV